MHHASESNGSILKLPHRHGNMGAGTDFHGTHRMHEHRLSRSSWFGRCGLSGNAARLLLRCFRSDERVFRFLSPGTSHDDNLTFNNKMSFSLHLDSKFSDLNFGENGTIYYLSDPIVLPSINYEFHVSVVHATIPLSFWVITESNNLLHLAFSAEDVFVSLPLGNRSIDELVAYLNTKLIDGFEASYDEAINRLIFTSDILGATLAIGSMTTCSKLLGVVVEQSDEDGVLIGSKGVDLAGTSSIFIRSNLSTRNRDPVTRAQSNVLAKVHVSRNFNEIEYHSSDLQFPVNDRSISVLVIYLTNDQQESIDLHGADYSLTLEFSLKEKQTIQHAVDYNLSRGLINSQNDPLSKPPDAPPSQPSDAKRDTSGPVNGKRPAE